MDTNKIKIGRKIKYFDDKGNIKIGKVKRYRKNLDSSGKETRCILVNMDCIPFSNVFNVIDEEVKQEDRK